MLKRDWLRGSINFFSSQSGVVLHVPLLGCVSQVFLGKRMVVYRFTGNPVHVIFLREIIIIQPAVVVTTCKNLLSSMLLFYSLEPRLRSRSI